MDGLVFREAREGDIALIVELMRDDPVSSIRDRTDGVTMADYLTAFRLIDDDPNHRLIVAELGGALAGSFQLSFLPGISQRGVWRGQIELVRVRPELRGKGIGQAMMEWAIARCREQGCNIVQLTTDRQREDAHRFYERLGFVPSHIGMKLKLA